MTDLDRRCITTIRTLAMDAVQQANSGHPGAPMGMAALGYLLWTRHLVHNPGNPAWFNRDRFILSNGHASMLLYALLHLTGYDLTLDDLRQFRQWGSRTPGHPEYGHTPGVETTTGPLGQGFANAVGMAMAEAHLAARFNRPDFPVVRHCTYVFCGDGDLMEGVSCEAASLAGHLGLGRLICLFDDNRITIEGGTDLSFSEDVAARFQACGWQVQDIGDAADDFSAVTAAVETARKESAKPSLIIVRTHIGYGSPHRQDTSAAHGEPLGAEEVRLTKRAYGWPEDEPFFVPEAVRNEMLTVRDRGEQQEAAWRELVDGYRRAWPELARCFELALAGGVPDGWDMGVPRFTPSDGPLATRAASGTILNAVARGVPWLIGGSADLAPSTKTLITGSPYLSRDNYAGRNIAWGVREHAMCSCANGIALHGGLRPFVSTFFIFTDYARPAMRLAALMKLPVIYIMTHDSLGVGEDGPTHQPVEQLASLRAMPGMTVIRPADATETVYAWRIALNRQGPIVLVLTRQNLPVLDRTVLAQADGALCGGYILALEQGATPELILIATGSEVHLALAAQGKLSEEGIDVRVVSMPSWELFREQPEEYRDLVLPPTVRCRLALEAGSLQGWCEWVGDRGAVIGVTQFGASAPAGTLFAHYGFTVENVVRKARELTS
jgi:transketolase